MFVLYRLLQAFCYHCGQIRHANVICGPNPCSSAGVKANVVNPSPKQSNDLQDMKLDPTRKGKDSRVNQKIKPNQLELHVKEGIERQLYIQPMVGGLLLPISRQRM